MGGRMRTRRWTWLVPACAAVLACNVGGGGTDPGAIPADVPAAEVDVPGDLAPADAGEDARPDAVPDVADVPPDGGPDVDPDALPDVRPDVDPDASPDAPPDLPPDVDLDAVPDVPPDAACEVLPPLEPFGLVIPAGGEGHTADTVVDADATVVRKAPHPDDGTCWNGPCHDVTFRLDDGTEQAITYQLPDGLELPVHPHQRVHLYLKLHQPWWTDAVLVIWKGEWDGMPIAFLHDAATTAGTWYDCGGREDCPSVRQVPTGCAPVEENCGTFVHPDLELSLFGLTSAAEGAAVLAQGTTRSVPGSPLRIRYVAAKSYAADTMDCVDYPTYWTAAAAVRQADVSQCRCSGDPDCRPGERCAVDLGRCVPDRCGMDSPCFGFCDAFTGACADAAPASCTTDADCGAGKVCHPALVRCTPDAGCVHEPVRGCVDNPCLVMKCGAGAECSPLLGGCVRCAADCQCPGYGDGGWCDGREAGGTCRTCDLAKVGLAQPQVFDFLVFCAAKAQLDLAALQAIDPKATCTGMGAALGKCDDATEVACRSDVPTTMKTAGLDDEAWGRACAFAALPWVSRVSGGFWE